MCTLICCLYLTLSQSLSIRCGLYVFGLSLFACADAFAQQNVDRSKVFELKDLDRSKSLDKTEFSGGSIGTMRAKSDGEFDRKDLDGNGELSLDEFLAPPQWSKEERQQRRGDDFVRLDTDGDGKVTKEQFLKEKEGAELQLAEERFARLDRNKDDVLTEDEFLEPTDLASYPRIQFRSRDFNRDGKLTMDEFLAKVKGKKIREDRERRTFGLLDLNKDGVLTIEEFAATDGEAAEQRRIQSLPPEERVFARLDESGDSFLSPKEFASRHGDRSYVEAQEKQFFESLDFDYSGSLDLNEFLSKDDPIPRVLFAKRDADGNGSVDLQEYARWVPAESQDREKRAFEAFDMNRDGVLSLDEFIRLERGRNGREWRAFFANMVGSPMSLFTLFIVLFDIVLVVVIGRLVIRRVQSKMKTRLAREPSTGSGTGSGV